MRKGVSAIIASVFLIALTVVIGGMVFLFNSEVLESLSPEIYCNDLNIESEIIFIGENIIELSLNNLGNYEITGVIISKKNVNSDSKDQKKINFVTVLNPGESRTELLNQIEYNSLSEYSINYIIFKDSQELICNLQSETPLQFSYEGPIIVPNKDPEIFGVIPESETVLEEGEHLILVTTNENVVLCNYENNLGVRKDCVQDSLTDFYCPVIMNEEDIYLTFSCSNSEGKTATSIVNYLAKKSDEEKK